MLYTFDGDADGDQFGSAVAGAGDVNMDGFDDVIVGARYDDSNGTDSGSVTVFSGADGSVLYTFGGDAASDWFGHSVGGAGDVNSDGVPDLIVGAPGIGNDPDRPGFARVLSGADGSVLHTFDGDGTADLFGYSVSTVGDVDGDGFDGMIVGARQDDNNGSNSGSARVFSGRDGSTLYSFDGDSADDWFGFSVGVAGDVNGDGCPDLVVGARGDSDSEPGWAHVFSGSDGSTLYTFYGDRGAQLGNAVSGAGDVDGDGLDDVIVGAHQTEVNGIYHAGRACVFSGADGSTLHTFEGDSSDDHLGSKVSDVGDVDGDGYADLLVSAPKDDKNGTQSGTIWVFSGADGSVLHTFDGDAAGDWYGHGIGGAGDVNGDGSPDFVVGAIVGGANGGGYVRVYSGCDGCKPLGTNYCDANANSTGVPGVISAEGSTVIALNNFTLLGTQLPTNEFGYFLMSDAKDFVPLFGGSSGNLCLGAPIIRFSTPPTGEVLNSRDIGEMEFKPDLTNLPQGTVFLPGDTWFFQLWFRDWVGGPTSNTTDGLEVMFS